MASISKTEWRRIQGRLLRELPGKSRHEQYSLIAAEIQRLLEREGFAPAYVGLADLLCAEFAETQEAAKCAAWFTRLGLQVVDVLPADEDTGHTVRVQLTR